MIDVFNKNNKNKGIYQEFDQKYNFKNQIFKNTN